MLAEEIMSTELKCAYVEQTLKDIQNIFNGVSYHHLPVTQDNKIVGIISDRDMLRLISPFLGTEQERECDLAMLDTLVKDFMTTKLITIDKSTSIDTASILLLEHSISCLPIVDSEGTLEGLLTWKDILKYYVYS